MNEIIFIRFISNILGIHVYCVSPYDHSLSTFEEECCFEKTLQPMYTAEYLEYILNHSDFNTFYEITDYLNTNICFFHFEDKQYIIGPYVKNHFSGQEIQELLATHKLPARIFMPIKLYYNQFPMLSYQMIRGTVMAAMRTFVPNMPEYKYRKLTGFHEEIKEHKLIEKSNKTYSQIMDQYEMENFFLRKISDGDITGVKLAFENIASNYYASTSQSQRSLYSTDWNGFAVLRTLARKAAEQGGCSVVKIDEITHESIQQYALARTGNELNNVQKDMLIKLTKAVADTKKMANYSPVIRNTLNYISANYSQNISLSELADMNHISEEHLSRSFKKEMGISITTHIGNIRVNKAAELLKSTSLSISDIALYIGYSDNNYFVKVFKKRYGMTPSAYRSLKYNNSQ